jgi:hypothetical protein
MIACIPLLIFGRVDSTGTIEFAPVQETCLQNARITTDKKGKKQYTLKDLSYQKTSDPFFTDIALSFNTPASFLKRDDTRHYRVIQSDYNLITGKGALGKGCAQFYKKEHGVAIETVKGAWLGTCDDLGSFTIELRLFPYELRDGSRLFTRVGYFSGTKRGIEIEIRNRTIVAGLYGIFSRPDGLPVDVVLKRGKELQDKKWYHFSLSFDRLSGALTKYLNGEEDEVRYMTESGEPFNGVYPPSFGKPKQDGKPECFDLPPVYIGKNYTGLIDEFRISYRHFDDLAQSTEIAYKRYRSVNRIGKIPLNIEGVITSPVYEFAETGTCVTEFRWHEQLLQDTFVWMQFRVADRLFTPESTEVKWYRVSNNQRNIYLNRENGDFTRGKYYQWRAHLVASPDGKRAPFLSGVELDYRLDLPPSPPILLEVASVRDREVSLRWKKNTESDILGYKIYYGTIPDVYDGIITTIGGNRITNSASTGNTMQVKITNDLIEENRANDKLGKLSYPVLKNTVLYYFAVSAYDSYKPDTAYNHESGLSKKIAARPYQGSEIK